MIHKDQQKGFSAPLLELILVIVIGLTIILASVNQYRQYEHRKDITIAKRNIYQLFQSAELYYNTNCAELQKELITNNSIAFSAETLIKDKFLPSKQYIKNPLVKSDANFYNFQDDFEVGVLVPKTMPAPRPYQLYVRGIFENEGQLEFYKDLVGKGIVVNEEGEDKTITWVKLPGTAIKDFETGLWQMRSGLRSFKKSQSIGSEACPAFQE